MDGTKSSPYFTQLLAGARCGSRGALDHLKQFVAPTAAASAAERLGIDDAGIDAVTRRTLDAVERVAGDFDSFDDLLCFVATLAHTFAQQWLWEVER